MARNKELLLAVMEEIEKFPETHDQATWFKPLSEPVPSKGGELCNTAYCFAGHSAVMSGVQAPELDDEQQELRRNRALSRFRWVVEPEAKTSVVQTVGFLQLVSLPEDHVQVEDYAQELLGLTADEAEKLFDAHNTRKQLRAMVDHLVADGEFTVAFADKIEAMSWS